MAHDETAYEFASFCLANRANNDFFTFYFDSFLSSCGIVNYYWVRTIFVTSGALVSHLSKSEQQFCARLTRLIWLSFWQSNHAHMWTHIVHWHGIWSYRFTSDVRSDENRLNAYLARLRRFMKIYWIWLNVRERKEQIKFSATSKYRRNVVVSASDWTIPL